MKNLVCLKKKIEDIIKKSSVPEDYPHSKNTLKWLLKLKPNADVPEITSHNEIRRLETPSTTRSDMISEHVKNHTMKGSTSKICHPHQRVVFNEALKIAALGHDIERAIEERKIKRSDYKTYEKFKDAHALNSANIIAEIMEDCKIKQELIDEVYFLVRHHEHGGCSRVNVLRDADTISFFDVNLQFYFKRNDKEETKRRWLWGYNKLPSNLKSIVAEFKYRDKKLKSLVDTWIANDKNLR